MFKKSFYYLWGSQTLSNTVDVFYLVALMTFVLSRTNSIVFATMVPFIRVTAQLLSGFLAPLMVVKYRLPFLLTISQSGQFLLFSLLALYLSPWNEGQSFLFIYGIIACISFLDGWTTPARNALVPRLVSDDVLMKANGMVATTDQVVQFAGWALSGLMVAKLGAFPVLIIVACGYGLAMLATFRIEDPLEPKRRSLWDWRTAAGQSSASNGRGALSDETKLPSRWDTLKEGWVLVWKSPRLRALTVMDVTDMLGGSVWAGAFMLVFVKEILLKNEQWWGYINASYFAGAVLGGLLVVAFVERLEKRIFAAMLSGMLGYAIATTMFAINSYAPLALLLVLFTGPLTELTAVSRRTLNQRSAKKEQLPQIFSAQATLLNTVFGISLLVMSGVAEWLGIVNMYLFASGITVIAMCMGILNRGAFREDSWREEINK